MEESLVPQPIFAPWNSKEQKPSVSPEQNPNFFPKQSERGLICAPRPLLTGAVHLSHFEYKTLKVLRSSKYSLLTLRSREQKPKIVLIFLLFLGGGGGGGGSVGRFRKTPDRKS